MFSGFQFFTPLCRKIGWERKDIMCLKRLVSRLWVTNRRQIGFFIHNRFQKLLILIAKMLTISLKFRLNWIRSYFTNFKILNISLHGALKKQSSWWTLEESSCPKLCWIWSLLLETYINDNWHMIVHMI